MTVRFLAEAEAELDKAVDHYNSQVPGLGNEFALEVQEGLSRIDAHPDAWQLIGRRLRRYRLSKFPYGLVYAELDTEIIIVAVMHLHRKPDYWQSRLAEE